MINCKVELSLRWIENCELTTAPIGDDGNATGADSATFKITDANPYVPIVTLLAEDNAKLPKLLSEGFKRSIYWNKYKVIDNKVVEIAANNEEKYIRELLYLSYQGVKRLFLLAYDNTADDNDHSNNVFVHSFKNIFFQELKQKLKTSKLTEKIFPISQLMTQLSNTTKSKKYQQDKVMIIRLVVY